MHHRGGTVRNGVTYPVGCYKLFTLIKHFKVFQKNKDRYKCKLCYESEVL